MIFSLPTRKRSALIFSLAAAACAAGLLTLAGAEAPSTSVQFSTHLITDQLRGGYSVAIADVNHDGKLDIVPVAAGSPELAWYENPGWERHVMLNDKKAMLWASPADIVRDRRRAYRASRHLGRSGRRREEGDRHGSFRRPERLGGPKIP